MTDIVAGIMTFAAEIAAALPGKLYDPVAWLALVAALLLGGTLRSGSSWANAVGWGVLAFAVLTLESFYLGAVPRADGAALALICVAGWMTGHQTALWLRRGSA